MCQILFIDCHVWGNTASQFQVTETGRARGTEIRGATGDGEAKNYLFKSEVAGSVAPGPPEVLGLFLMAKFKSKDT